MTNENKLETLNDIKDSDEILDKIRRKHKHCAFEDGPACIACINEAKLETINKTRQEAIKWVKRYKEIGETVKRFSFSWYQMGALIEEFKEFFNITEEDLKNEK